MVRIDATYDGGLRCTATHIPSGNKLTTDAPVDNRGKGESFSPTDLLATSMLTCIMTIIAIHAEHRGLNVNGMHGSVEKHMSAKPRKVGKLNIEITLPNGLSPDDRKLLMKKGHECPVHKSVSEEMEVEIYFS